jgi:nitrogen regulatory protein PII
LDEVKEALDKVHVSGMTVTEVRGHGRQKGHAALYRGNEYNVTLLPKMEVEVIVPDEAVDSTIRAIVSAARTACSSRRSSTSIAFAPVKSASRDLASGPTQESPGETAGRAFHETFSKLSFFRCPFLDRFQVSHERVDAFRGGRSRSGF